MKNPKNLLQIHKIVGLFRQLTKKATKKLSTTVTKLYYREEEPEYTIPEGWQKNKPSIKQTTNQTTKTTTLPITSTHKIRRTRIHIPLLRTTKQIIAGILFLLNGFVGLAGLASANPGIGLLFLLNAFIILDYLWKLSHWRIIQEEE